MEAIYEEVGFARSLLAYELPDGRLKLNDGHLRRDMNPEMEVDVEVLGVFCQRSPLNPNKNYRAGSRFRQMISIAHSATRLRV